MNKQGIIVILTLLVVLALFQPVLSADISAETGFVTVVSIPSGASISIDGKPVGTAPVMGTPLTAGVHQVQATLPGHQLAETGFSLSPGEQKALTLNLVPLAPPVTYTVSPTVPTLEPFPIITYPTIITRQTTIPFTIPTTRPVTITIPTTEPFVTITLPTVTPTSSVTVTIPTTEPIVTITIPTVITTRPTTQVPGQGKGWIATHCNVDGAVVSFDQQSAGCRITNSVCTVEVGTTGTPYRTFTVQAPGWNLYTGSVSSWPGDGQTVNLYATLTPVPPQTGVIVVTTNPDGAAIYLNGDFQGFAPMTLQDLAPRQYTVMAKLDGYSPVSQYVSVYSGQTSYFNTVLNPSPQPPRNTGDVIFVSNPGGAQVFVDSVYKGVTSQTVTLFPGNHNIRLTIPGYYDWTSTVYVAANTRQTVTATLIAVGSSGWITISSSPSGVNVYLDDLFRGQTDSSGSSLINGVSPGLHVLKLTKPGYIDFTTVVPVSSGVQSPVTAILTPRGAGPAPTSPPGTGGISAVSTPAGAGIYVDNVYLGITPATLTGIAAGPHVVTLKLQGYMDTSSNVQVQSGSTLQVTAALSPVPTVEPTKAGANAPWLACGALIIVGFMMLLRRGAL